MARFMIERNFAEQLEINKTAADEVKRINDDMNIKWLFSFLSADKKKTYCLYEAPNAEAIRAIARGGPAWRSWPAIVVSMAQHTRFWRRSPLAVSPYRWTPCAP